MTATEVFNQNNGDVTRQFYQELALQGPVGRIGVALFRAQKRSTRAKVYRRGKFRRAAYDVKSWSMSELCRELEAHGTELGFCYGWKQDHNTVFGERSSWVLYCDIPGFGQVSFLSPERLSGPDYAGDWDGEHKSAERIIAFCEQIMAARTVGAATA